MKHILLALAVLSFLVSCKTAEENNNTFGAIEWIDPSLGNILDSTARMEVLSEGYDWSEGPLWVASENMLLFSDVPMNTVYKWTERDSVEVFLRPSGFTGQAPSNSDEEGSNGLALNADGRLVLCQHGDRRLAVLDAPLDGPQPKYSTLAATYEGKRFNSPNDVAIRSNGDYFFTDPAYGLPKNIEQEIPFQGVYKLSGSTVTLLVDSITRPNGIAFMPGERKVIIANSDRQKPVWYIYDLADNDSFVNGRIFHDATADAEKESGLPDGLKIDRNGNVFATGPGGVWIFNQEGTVLGKLKIPVSTANCAFDEEESTLYITADTYLLRLKMRKGS